jgi:hypothetical protein
MWRMGKVINHSVRGERVVTIIYPLFSDFTYSIRSKKHYYLGHR